MWSCLLRGIMTVILFGIIINIPHVIDLHEFRLKNQFSFKTHMWNYSSLVHQSGKTRLSTPC